MYPHHIHSFVVIYKNNTYEVCSKMASNKLLTKKNYITMYNSIQDS